MTDEEVEIVAEELAKLGGVAWYPGWQRSHPIIRVVTERYRAQARIVIATLDRLRGAQDAEAPDQGSGDPLPDPVEPDHDGMVRPGATVIYRPAGERRAYPCRVMEIRGSRAYLAPILRLCVGWVSVERLEPGPDEGDIDRERTG